MQRLPPSALWGTTKSSEALNIGQQQRNRKQVPQITSAKLENLAYIVQRH